MLLRFKVLFQRVLSSPAAFKYLSANVKDDAAGDDADVDITFYGVNAADFSVYIAFVVCLNVVFLAY